MSQVAVDQLEFNKVVRRSSAQKRVDIVKDFSVDAIHPVDDRLETHLLLKGLHHLGKLVTTDSTVIKKESGELLIVYERDRLGKTFTVSFTHLVLLQEKCHIAEFFNYSLVPNAVFLALSV